VSKMSFRLELKDVQENDNGKGSACCEAIRTRFGNDLQFPAQELGVSRAKIDFCKVDAETRPALNPQWQ